MQNIKYYSAYGIFISSLLMYHIFTDYAMAKFDRFFRIVRYFCMEKVDLHVHSTASDGTLTPSGLVKEAQKAGLSAFALTDHDTVDGIAECINAGKKLGIEVIPGIEISTRYKDKEIHIVGLCIDYTSDSFLKSIGSELERRNERNAKLIDKFNAYGFPISMEALTEMFPDSVITRAHFASYMVKKGYVKDNAEAFARYLGDGMPLYVPREKREPEEAIQIIKAAGGAAILAHPLLYHLTDGELSALCSHLKSCGLCGIETMYSTYKGFDELNVRKLAHQYNLLESGGSDFHGANKPHISLGSGCGNLCISYSYLKAIKDSVSYSPKE